MTIACLIRNTFVSAAPPRRLRRSGETYDLPHCSSPPPPPRAAIDAEHAFARDAQRIGQWSAFRKYADRDAVMFTPQAVWARDFLKGRKDPPKAISWRPAHSFVSCDGRTAVNTGPWFTQDGTPGGYFTTVWQRTPARLALGL